MRNAASTIGAVVNSASPAPIAIDGAYGEGGGQLVRTAVALAAVTGRALSIRQIRAKRTKPGLAPQHAAAVAAIATLCDARVDGLALRSNALEFAPGRLHGGTFQFDIGTAGSITLVLQALLPALVACGERAAVVVRGGTDVRAAPPLDYFREVTLPLLARFGVRAQLVVRRRGYYPKGGGEVALTVDPSRLMPAALTEPGATRRVRGVAHVAGLDVDIARRMRDTCVAGFPVSAGFAPAIEAAALSPELAFGTGGAIVAWAETERTRHGAGRIAERGVRAEALGSAVASELREDLAAAVAVDVHAADQLPVWLALAGGGAFTTRMLTSHAQTTIWLVPQFLPVRFACRSEGPRVRVDAQPQLDAGTAR